MDWVFPLHLFLTFYMTGLIWFVQLVHYPLMDKVGIEYFQTYEQAHTQRTSWVVAPQMVAELATGLWLWYHAWQIPWHWLNIGLLALIWASTFLIQVPLHNRLTQGFEAAAHRRLVQSNWLRTIAWTLRSALLLCI